MNLLLSRCHNSFGLAGLAAPQGVLGPVGTNRGAERSAPLLSPLSLPRLSGRGARTMPGPKTQSCPRAERTQIVLWEGAPPARRPPIDI